MKALFMLIVITVLMPVAYAAPACWVLQPSKSHLTFTGDQAGAPANGEFGQFGVKFCFDPAQAKGQLRVTVNLASLDTHNSRRDKVLKGKAFFDVSQYPTAIYEAQKFSRAGDGQFIASGMLSLKGVTKPVQVSFDFHDTGKHAVIKGAVTIQRLDYGIGEGRWANTRWVGNKVVLGFDLHFTRAP